MFENLAKDNLTPKFYDEVTSESVKETKKLLSDLEHNLLGLTSEQKKLQVEKALKQTVSQLSEVKGSDPLLSSIGSPVKRKSEIERFSADRMAIADINEWLSGTEELRGLLGKMRQNASTWLNYVFDKVSETGDEPSPEINSDSLFKDFELHNFFYSHGDTFFDELETTERICSELDALFQDVARTLEEDKSDIKPIKLRHHASDLRLKVSEIDEILQRVQDVGVATYYDDVFPSDLKHSVVVALSLYGYKRELEQKIEAFAAPENNSVESEPYEYEVGDNLTLKNHSEKYVKTQVVNLRDGLKELGIIPKDTDGNVFSSIFANRTINNPVVWKGTQYELHFLIKQFKGFMEKSTSGSYARAEKLFLNSDGSKFKNLMNAGGNSKLPPQRASSYRKLLDRVTRNLK